MKKKLGHWTLLAIFSNALLTGASQVEQIDLRSLAKKASPAIMLITISDSNGKDIANGTGFLISSDGKMITNYHVVEKGNRAVAKAANGGLFVVEGILAFDQKNDLAVLKIACEDLPFLTLGSIKNIEVGSRIAIIGSPLGLASSMSEGIVSAIRKFESGAQYIQMTAAISPGSSGSPVFDTKGRIIGIAKATIKEGQALNIAVPADAATELVVIADKAERPRPMNETGARDDSAIIEDRDFLDAKHYESIKDYARQLRCAKSLVGRYPHNSTAHTILGGSYAHLNLYNEAIASFATAIELNPENVDAWLILADVYEKTQQYEKAEVAYFAAAKINPDEAKIYFGQIYKMDDKAERYEQASVAARKIIELEPYNETNFYYLGLALFNAKKYDEAIATFKQALSIKPDFPHAWFQIGSSYANQEKFLDAALAYKQYSALAPTDPSGWLSIGVAYMQAKWFTDALEYMKKAVELSPTNAVAQFNLAIIYVNLRDNKNAKIIYNKLRTLNASYAERLRPYIR